MAVSARNRRGQGIVVATVLTVLAAQIYLNFQIDHRRLNWADVEYGTTVRNLDRRRKEFPDRPIVLALGSSRTKDAFAADRLSEPTPDDPAPPLALNGAIFSVHPFQFQLALRRYLAIGMRPKAVLIELLPLHMSDSAKACGPDPQRIELPLKPETGIQRMRMGDLDLVWDYDRERAGMWYGRWLESRAAPWHTHRDTLLDLYAPSWAPPETAANKKYWRSVIGPYGWVQSRMAFVPPEFRGPAEKATEDAYRSHTGFVSINRGYDRMLRDLLKLCREEGIEVLGLMLMPESKTFRSWYPEATQRLIGEYANATAAEFGTRLIDATRWIPDAEFFDHHHVIDPGAERFSERIRTDIIRPWMAKR